MAGGQNRAGTPPPAWLADAGTAARAARTARAARGPRRRAFCWVHGADADFPALVLEWHRAEDGWRARVVWTTGEGSLFCAWLAAEALEPADQADQADP